MIYLSRNKQGLGDWSSRKNAWYNKLILEYNHEVTLSNFRNNKHKKMKNAQVIIHIKKKEKKKKEIRV